MVCNKDAKGREVAESSWLVEGSFSPARANLGECQTQRQHERCVQLETAGSPFNANNVTVQGLCCLKGTVHSKIQKTRVSFLRRTGEGYTSWQTLAFSCQLIQLVCVDMVERNIVQREQTSLRPTSLKLSNWNWKDEKHHGREEKVPDVVLILGVNLQFTSKETHLFTFLALSYTRTLKPFSFVC